MRADDYSVDTYQLQCMVVELEDKYRLMKSRLASIEDTLIECATIMAPGMASSARELKEREADGTWKYGVDGTPKCRHCGKEWMAMPAAKYCPFCGYRNSWVKKNGHS